jgi:hypothetical protein
MAGIVSRKGLASAAAVVGIVAAATVASVAPSFAAEKPLAGAKNAYCYQPLNMDGDPERYLLTNPRFNDETWELHWEMEFQRWDGTQYVKTQGADNPWKHDGNPWTGVRNVPKGNDPPTTYVDGLFEMSDASGWCGYANLWPDRPSPFGRGDWA